MKSSSSEDAEDPEGHPLLFLQTGDTTAAERQGSPMRLRLGSTGNVQLGHPSPVCETNTLVQLRISSDFVSEWAEIVRALGTLVMAPRRRFNGR